MSQKIWLKASLQLYMSIRNRIHDNSIYHVDASYLVKNKPWICYTENKIDGDELLPFLAKVLWCIYINFQANTVFAKILWWIYINVLNLLHWTLCYFAITWKLLLDYFGCAAYLYAINVEKLIDIGMFTWVYLSYKLEFLWGSQDMHMCSGSYRS